jgi:hypothetical protein
MGRIRGQEAKKRVENVLLESKGVSLALWVLEGVK